MVKTMRKTNTHSGIRAIPTRIRAKCGKCWGALKNATLGDKQRWCICARARIYALLMSDYVRGRTTSLPTRKCLRRRDEETFGKRLRSERAFFLRFFVTFSRSTFFLSPPPSSFARSFRSRWFWFCLPLRRNRTPRYSLALCFPRESAHYVVSCRKAKPWLLISLRNPLDFNSRSRKHNSR